MNIYTSVENCHWDSPGTRGLHKATSPAPQQHLGYLFMLSSYLLLIDFMRSLSIFFFFCLKSSRNTCSLWPVNHKF